MSNESRVTSDESGRDPGDSAVPVTKRCSSLLAHYWKDILWLIMLALYIVAGMPLTPFHGDESTQIYMSRDYAYQFIQHDLRLVTFSDPPISATEQHLRLINGTINKYLIGLAWHLSGLTIRDLNEQWDWGADWSYNQQYGHAPGEALLRAARWPSALLLAVGLIPVFAIGHALDGRLTAFLASLYYALNPALLINGRRAMMEGSLIFFSVLVVLAGVRFLQKRPTSRKQYLTVVLLGAASGLAVASKHTALFTVAAVFGACILWPFVSSFAGTSHTVSARYFGLLMLAAVLAVFTFYALNPAWWGDPVGRAGQVLVLRQRLLDEQVAAFGGYPTLIDRIAGFARQTLINLPQYYEAPAWADYIGDQIARYEASVWHGMSVGGSLVGTAVLSSIIVAGIWTLLRNRRIASPTRWLVGVWALVMIASTLLLTPLEWQRYYLPAYPAVGLLAALGLSRLIQMVRRWYDQP